jgi:hypothetical protein
MHVSATNVLLYMILYDENYVFIYLVGLSPGIFVSYMNRSKDEILFMVVSRWMSCRLVLKPL